ncbi:MAG: restriction endonuclease [Oscillibacter sp.]|nr:restriction endonuclease [Oscillibacter sp.]MEA4992806.1 restriction endonuclease [Oscillibacter sp.]
MAKLNFVEKDCFERLFGMSSGYVLDFSNRTFQEFVYEILSFDIYIKYPNLSKAKILRAIIAEYDNVSVGKLLLELMRYMQAKGMVNDEDREVFKQCADIGNRLIGKSAAFKQTASTSTSTAKPITSLIDYDKYIRALQVLSDYDDSPQSRGFAFEKYLKEFFEINGLQPRGSFKLIGEQIDGSFILHNEVYLLEAKWTSKPIDKANLVVFNEKVSSKSGFTRGLYISYSGYSEEALKTFATGRTINIVLMTVQELAIVLSQKKDFSKFLWSKVRALAEEGDFNKSVFEMNN